jgi:hypothetical protein
MAPVSCSKPSLFNVFLMLYRSTTLPLNDHWPNKTVSCLLIQRESHRERATGLSLQSCIRAGNLDAVMKLLLFVLSNTSKAPILGVSFSVHSRYVISLPLTFTWMLISLADGGMMNPMTLSALRVVSPNKPTTYWLVLSPECLDCAATNLLMSNSIRNLQRSLADINPVS